MNVSNKLLTMIFTGFMLVQIQANAQTAAQKTAMTRPAATASTNQQNAAAPAAASKPTINVNTANAANPAAQQDINDITFGLREVKGLQNTLNALPTKIHAEIKAKMAAAKEPLTINQVRALINAYLRGTPAVAGTPSKIGAVAAEAAVSKPAVTVKK